MKLLVAIAGLALAVGSARAESVAPGSRDGVEPPPELKGVELVEKLGAKLPLDLEFTDETGAPIRLGSLFGDGKPVLLTFNYSSCPMLCSVQLGGLVASLGELSWSAGQEFRVVTIGLNPMEGHRQAMASKLRYLERYRRPTADEGWRFLTGTEKAIQTLAAAVGYGYRLNPKTGEYLHPAALTVLTPEGVVSSYVYGVEYPSKALTVTLIKAKNGELVEGDKKFLMACFHYEKPAGAAAVAMKVMRIGGVAFLGVMLVAFGVSRASRRGKKKA